MSQTAAPAQCDIPLAAHGDFDAARLTEAKGTTTITVCFPARDEADTIGPIVEATRRDLVDACPLVDEVLVLDDHSTDRTGVVAAAAGARVVDARTVLPHYGRGAGKGEALWRSLHVARGDLVAWCDADIAAFDTHFLVGLLGPLVLDPYVQFTKGFYERPGGEGGATGGGRVTELLARPLIATLFPHLGEVVQPLSGEYAGRRALLERLPFASGYGVDLGLLVDVAAAVGCSAITQVDLGIRRHRNRSLDDLGPQAVDVLHAALARAGVDPPAEVALVRPGLVPVARHYEDLPALASLASLPSSAPAPAARA